MRWVCKAFVFFVLFLSPFLGSAESFDSVKKASLSALTQFIDNPNTVSFYKAAAQEVQRFLLDKKTDEKFSTLTLEQQIFFWKLLPKIVYFLDHADAQKLIEDLLKKYAPGANTSIDDLSIFRKTRFEYEDLRSPNDHPFQVIFDVNDKMMSRLLKAMVQQKINFNELSISFKEADSIEILITIDGLKLLSFEVNSPAPPVDVSLFIATQSAYTFDILNIVEDGEISALEYVKLGSIYMNTTLSNYSEDLPRSFAFLERTLNDLKPVYDFFTQKTWGSSSLTLQRIYSDLWHQKGFQKMFKKGFFKNKEYYVVLDFDELKHLMLMMMDLSFSLSQEELSRSYPSIPKEMILAIINENTKTLTPWDLKSLQNGYGNFPKLNETVSEEEIKDIYREVFFCENLITGRFSFLMNGRKLVRQDILYNLRQSRILNFLFDEKKDNKLVSLVLSDKIVAYVYNLRETNPQVDQLLPALQYLQNQKYLGEQSLEFQFLSGKIFGASVDCFFAWEIPNDLYREILIDVLGELKSKTNKTPKEEILFSESWIIGKYLFEERPDLNPGSSERYFPARSSEPFFLSKLSSELSFDDTLRSWMAIAALMRDVQWEKRWEQKHPSSKGEK